MTTEFGVLIGFLFAALGCDPLVRIVIRQVRVDPTVPTDEESFLPLNLSTFVNDKGARWLGGLERTLFFVSFYLAAPEMIAGWLLFKVASKWESWQNIIRVPSSIEDIDTLEFLRYRQRWGVTIMQSFLVGTLANILAGLAGNLIARRVIGLMGG